MVKCNYFENLEALSILALEAVRSASGIKEGEAKSQRETRLELDRLVFETENALFSDFLPPLERDNIAAMSHALARIYELASELGADSGISDIKLRKNKEAAVCVSLMEMLCDNIALLKKIKHPKKMPALKSFRELSEDGRIAHKEMILSIGSGALPRSYSESVILTGRLRGEICRAFDELIEIMLNNI